MTIEINTPQSEVPEHIIFYLRGKLMDLYHRYHQISKVEVVLRHQQIPEGNNYVCEVTLWRHDDSIMIHRSSESYLQALREILKELFSKIDELSQGQNELAEEIVSTVRV